MDVAQVVGHEERSGKDGPHGHLGIGLVLINAVIANNNLQKSTSQIKSVIPIIEQCVSN